MANPKLHLQLQSDTILTVLGMIGGYPPDDSICSLGMEGLPGMFRDFFRQNSWNFSRAIESHSPFHKDQLDFQSFQIFESKDQNSRSRFLGIGFFALRLYTASC